MLAKASLRTSTACRMSSRSMCGNLNLRTSSSVTPVCPLAPDSACWNWICPSGDANRSTNAIGSIPEGRRIATWLSIANSSSRSKRTGFPMLVPPSTVKSTSFLFGGLAQPYSNTARDAPPVAVSRVGCGELSLTCSSVTAKSSRSCSIVSMPTNLHRYYGAGYSHFITTSCYQRRPLLGTPRSRDLFLEVMEQIRQRHQFVVVG